MRWMDGIQYHPATTYYVHTYLVDPEPSDPTTVMPLVEVNKGNICSFSTIKRGRRRQDYKARFQENIMF